jgi:hypothetical protein
LEHHRRWNEPTLKRHGHTGEIWFCIWASGLRAKAGGIGEGGWIVQRRCRGDECKTLQTTVAKSIAGAEADETGVPNVEL